jgi:hypothetical protein
MTTPANNHNVIKMFPDQPSALEIFGEDGFEFPTDDEDAMTEEEIHREAQIRTMVTMSSNRLAQEFIDMGMDPHDASHEFCFIVESIVSYVLKHHDLTHELQNLAELTVSLEDEERLVFSFIPPKISIPDTDLPTEEDE